MVDDQDLIHLAGGDEKLAKACGVSVDALRKWREIRRIPPKHWSTVAKMAGVPLADVAVARLPTTPRRQPRKRAA